MLGKFEPSLIDIVGGWLQGHSGSANRYTVYEPCV
jgi:hypothetical protein